MRQMIFRAAVVGGLLVVASTEILSLFHILGFWGLLLFWLASLALGVGIFYKKINVPTAASALRERAQ